MNQIELMKCIIEQNWLHARHAESNLLWYNNLYFSVVTAVLVYLGSSLANPYSIIYNGLLMFLFLLSIFGFIITSKLSAEFGNHMDGIRKMLNEKAIDLKDYMAFPLNTGIWKHMKVKKLFKLLYVVTSTLWLILLVQSITVSLKSVFGATG